MLRIITSISFLFFVVTSSAQVIDIAKDRQSPDRITILNLLREKVKQKLKQDVTFVVRSLTVKNNYAFLKGNLRNVSGGQINFRKTIFKDAVKEGMFGGDEIFALFKKSKSGTWQNLVHAIGPTDVVYAC